MRRPVLRSAIFLAVLVVALAALAPATLVDAWLAAKTAGAWRIADARGLWWRGDGTLISSGAPARLPFGWRIAPAALVRGSLGVDLSAQDGTPIATIAVNSDRLRVERLDLREPAALATALTAQVAPAAGMLAAGGALAIESPSLEWSGGRAAGHLAARWTHARLALAGIALDLGEVTLELVPQAGARAWRGELANRGGDLALRGTIDVDGPATSAEIALTPRIAASPAIRNALTLLGRPDATGSVRVAWRASR